jgi:hypothetical protein
MPKTPQRKRTKTPSTSKPAVSPFTFIGEINGRKDTSILTEDTEMQYVPFVINRSLSYFVDAVMAANEMNRLHTLPKDLQFKYLCAKTSPRPRFGKWAVPPNDGEIASVAKAYECSLREAADIMTALNPTEIKQIALLNP